jgi:hypothetical protein
MDAATRRGIAYIAGRLISGRSSSSLYDYTEGRQSTFSGQVSTSRVNVFDQDRGSYITGTPPSLFDHGTGAYVRLTTQGDRFKGFDYQSGDHFSGRVNGRAVSLFDYGSSSYYSYTV